MVYRRSLLAGALAALALSSSALANGARGTAEEAKTMLDKAVAHVKAVGPEKAFDDFNRPDGGFVDRDLYVFVWSKEPKAVAHGGNKAMIGRDMSKLKDADGRDLTKLIMDAGAKPGGDVIEYKWTDPISKKLEMKASYIVPVNDLVMGVGFYK